MCSDSVNYIVGNLLDEYRYPKTGRIEHRLSC